MHEPAHSRPKQTGHHAVLVLVVLVVLEVGGVSGCGGGGGDNGSGGGVFTMHGSTGIVSTY